jgi:hypothetical protein
MDNIIPSCDDFLIEYLLELHELLVEVCEILWEIDYDDLLEVDCTIL